MTRFSTHPKSSLIDVMFKVVSCRSVVSCASVVSCRSVVSCTAVSSCRSVSSCTAVVLFIAFLAGCSQQKTNRANKSELQEANGRVEKLEEKVRELTSQLRAESSRTDELMNLREQLENLSQQVQALRDDSAVPAKRDDRFAGMAIKVVFPQRRVIDGMEVVQRLRSRGAQVATSVTNSGSNEEHEGKIYFSDGQLEMAKEIAEEVSDYEKVTPKYSDIMKSNGFTIWIVR